MTKPKEDFSADIAHMAASVFDASFLDKKTGKRMVNVKKQRKLDLGAREEVDFEAAMKDAFAEE